MKWYDLDKYPGCYVDLNQAMLKTTDLSKIPKYLNSVKVDLDKDFPINKYCLHKCYGIMEYHEFGDLTKKYTKAVKIISYSGDTSYFHYNQIKHVLQKKSKIFLTGPNMPIMIKNQNYYAFVSPVYGEPDNFEEMSEFKMKNLEM